MSPGRLALMILAMAAFAVAVYLGLGSLRHSTPAAVKRPADIRSSMAIAGDMYLTQDGGLYRLHADRFTELQPAGNGWTQPAVSPDHGTLAVVRRSSDWSDLFLVDLAGHPRRQLTQNQGSDVTTDHWAFYPRFSADGAALFYSFDSPKDGYRVDLAIWSQELRSGATRRWTLPTGYTGGDVDPTPAAAGVLLFVEYAPDAGGHIRAQVQLQRGALAVSRALTTREDDCAQPTLSPDGSRVAMICSGGQQVARLEVASFDGSTLGPLKVLVDGQLCAVPAWQPDGQAIAYLAPAGPAGRFQLWYLPLPGDASVGPALPRRLTSGLDFDATSRIAWFMPA